MLMIKMNEVFNKAENYIIAIGISKPIPADRDKDGKLIFDLISSFE